MAESLTISPHSSSVLVIKEAAHLKKHNLFEETHLPSESVSSLSDLKTPSGSAQASPARKPATNLTEASHADIQSNEVFVPEVTQEVCEGTAKTLENEERISANVSSLPVEGREEEMISDVSGKQESPSMTLTAAEEAVTPQLPKTQETNYSVTSRTENKVLVEEEKAAVLDSVNEIRNLLTVTVELPLDDPSENKENVQECGISKAQGSVEEREKEDEMIADECQKCETQESPKVSFQPSVERGTITVTSSISPPVESNNINIISTPGEGRYRTETDSPDLSKESEICQASKTNLETTSSIWYTDVDNGSANAQAEQHVESGQSDQSGLDFPPTHFIPVDEKPQVEQHVERGQSEQVEGGSRTLLCASVEDSPQVGSHIENEESGLSLLHSVLPEVDSQIPPSCSIETQESAVLNITDLRVESTDLLISPEIKEDNTVETSVNTQSQSFTVAEGDASMAAIVSLQNVDVADVTGEEGTRESVVGNCPESQSEK